MQKLSQFVVKRLQGTALVGPHPEADLLTAFAEQALPGGERAFVMEHLARCGDCRDVVALALPESEIETAAFAPARVSGRGWFAWPALRWGTLAAGILAVASVGVMQYEHSKQGPLVAEHIASRSNNMERTPPEVASNAALLSTPSLASVDSTRPGSTVKLSTPGRASASHAKTSPARSALAEGQELIAQNQIDQPMMARPDQSFDVVKAKEPVPLETSLAQWMVTSDGALRRSFDQGQTWENVHPWANIRPAATGSIGDQAALLSVAANGSEVWAGGAAGAIFYCADGGNSWTRLSLSAGGVALTGDISSIQFSDPQHGTIATSTGELWATSNAGETWAKQ